MGRDATDMHPVYSLNSAPARQGDSPVCVSNGVTSAAPILPGPAPSSACRVGLVSAHCMVLPAPPWPCRSLFSALMHSPCAESGSHHRSDGCPITAWYGPRAHVRKRCDCSAFIAPEGAETASGRTSNRSRSTSVLAPYGPVTSFFETVGPWVCEADLYATLGHAGAAPIALRGPLWPPYTLESGSHDFYMTWR